MLGEVEHGEPGVRPPVLHPDQPRRVAGGRQAQVREPSLGGVRINHIPLITLGKGKKMHFYPLLVDKR